MKDLPVRKHPRLQGYDYNQNGAYFITLCVKERHEMLGKIIVGRDAHIAPHIQLSEYGAVVRKYLEAIDSVNDGVHIDKYVVMPNHVHMILVLYVNDANHGAMWASHPTNAMIPKIIRSLKILVTKEIGFSLWQPSYHDHIIRNKDEYLKIWQYIDENPAKWAEDCYHVLP